MACRFLYEGQEEVGSPNLPSFLTSHADGLLSGVDLVLNADGGQPGATTPGICTGTCMWYRTVPHRTKSIRSSRGLKAWWSQKLLGTGQWGPQQGLLAGGLVAGWLVFGGHV